ncbi:acyl-CoA dehydrogenase [Siccirubricoccus deserti]|uniref:Acyl-CoA dehydrogenase family protein n=1 Tax=Siccirubricoccus deserti TaxID=2013562 RepID=A0A9X0QVJ4_9PROT|nr:acyl-CoA dehydrogenase family protein [Siccirubricoccus deserti]MBC4014714.1 acyl-CoA dehydrogenase family protein [Siccirubricoccus deserti]GGC34418.1 acyl-CoA dehydrogenase [Siccirubricoccus deserti]
MGALRFDLRDTPPEAPALRAELRAFLADHGRNWSPTVRGYSWMGFDRDFSREVAKRGWVGMTWPRTYGGGERTALERYVVLEEMLAVGAPVGAHWIGDRQSGPLILRLGTEEQRRDFLPRIVNGDLAFAIGLSEPDSGSDLASLRTRATKVPGGWRIDGRKVWTTNAHRCDFMIALLRTSPPPDPRAKHQGLSQFLVDLRSSGLTIRPILDLVGEEGFNEITFDNVFVPDSLLVGKEGNGWEQATAELAFERAGPERYLSSLPLLTAALDDLRAEPAAAETVGRLLARAGTLRQMSLAVAGMLQDGQTPAREAALVKDAGNDYEQALPETLRNLFDPDRTPAEVQEMQRVMTMVARSYSLRGGTREILRGIIARQLGLR